MSFFRIAVAVTFLCSILCSTSSVALALSSPFLNLNQIAWNVGFSSYSRAASPRVIRIAILDNGFRGWRDELGKTIPSTTRYHEGPVQVDPKSEESHGLAMAQIVAGLLESVPGFTYRLDLFSAFGFSNFSAAAQEVARGAYDIVLYSQVWEYGGQGDGRGFINSVVTEAIEKSGVIWINAAGNFGRSTFLAPVIIGTDQWLRLPQANDSVRIRCQPRAAKPNASKPSESTASAERTCNLRAVLSWNDFKDDVSIGTDKDLDLVMTDDTLRIVASSGLTQMSKIPSQAPPGASLYPREIVNTRVPEGLYFARVKARSKNFNANRDWIRLTVSGEGVSLLDTTSAETILPPGDNPLALTVGASDSDKSASSPRALKPEVLTHSLLQLSEREQYIGSSNAAAITAASAVVLKALHPNYERDQMIRALTTGSQGNRTLRLPLYRGY